VRTLLIIILLSALALIPDVRNAVSEAITETRDSIFSSLYSKSRINRKARERQRLDIGTPVSSSQQSSRPSSPSNIRPVKPSTTVNVSDELRQKRWTTTKEIFY